MNFKDYLNFIKPFKEICKGFPVDDKTFIIHYEDCKLRIKDFELFKYCWNEHRKVSHFFPSNVELFKIALPELPPIDADDVLKCNSHYATEINNILCEKYGLSLPDPASYEFKNSLRATSDKWRELIRFNLPKLFDDYKNLKIDPSEIFTEQVLLETNTTRKAIGLK